MLVRSCALDHTRGEEITPFGSVETPRRPTQTNWVSAYHEKMNYIPPDTITLPHCQPLVNAGGHKKTAATGGPWQSKAIDGGRRTVVNRFRRSIALCVALEASQPVAPQAGVQRGRNTEDYPCLCARPFSWTYRLVSSRYLFNPRCTYSRVSLYGGMP